MTKIAVIGAGTARLASAIRLKTLGYDVDIYEKNQQVGGRMYQISDQGFSFDVGPTIVMMPELYKEVFEFSGADAADYLDMQLLDPMNRVYFAGSSNHPGAGIPIVLMGSKIAVNEIVKDIKL